MLDILEDIDIRMKTVKLQASVKFLTDGMTNDFVGQYMLGVKI
jgi:hypothetical protein